MLKNVQDAKFNKTLIPISKVVLDPAEQSALAFDSFFTHILCHELMHGTWTTQHHRRLAGNDRAQAVEGALLGHRRGEADMTDCGRSST
jgi:hypothetical protein